MVAAIAREFENELIFGELRLPSLFQFRDKGYDMLCAIRVFRDTFKKQISG